MTNNKLKNSFLALLLLAIIAGCSDQFLVDKGDFAGFNEEIYNDVLTAQAKVDYLYYLCLPAASNGSSDTYTKSTEEFAGSTTYTQLTEKTSNDIDDEFYKSQTGGPYAFIRECNIFLDNIDKGTLTDTQKKTMKGEIYFWRAWNYFNLVRTYGGVPIVLTAQNAILGEGDPEQTGLAVQRSSTADCITLITEDLDKAISMLPGKWDDANWGRISSGAAAAFKGRVLLTYASPLFNRNMETSRWQAAYDANKAAKELLDANGFGLVSATANHAKDWEKMFVTPKTTEAVMTVLNNTVTTDSYKKNNGWENSARPKELQGGGGFAATSEMLDLFPMADGKRPGQSSFTYDPLKFYKDRDPRFYRTFAFNGCIWPYGGNTTYGVWTYQWFKDDAAVAAATTKEGSGFAEYAGHVNSGIYVRKRTDPAAGFTDVDKFARSASPYIEIRYAEVLLNLAESAVGINKLGKADEGYQGLFALRARVGIPAGADGNYGVPAGLDKYGLFREILFERQIEFAYEGKRFYDMRRWMLWNDDPAIQNTTCAQLGVEPMNGKRHHGIILAVKPSVYKATSAGIANDIFNPLSTKYDATKVTRAGIGLNPDDTDANFAKQITALDKFYDTNLTRVTTDFIDGTSAPLFYTTFRSKYYFIGIKQSVLKQSPYLFQTIGWDDYYGANGTFNPLQ
jgi:starch-binding outer membrane protein, SusD/RagB family